MPKKKDACPDNKAKGGVAHRRTPVSDKTRHLFYCFVCIYEFLSFTRNFDQNVCPVRGAYCANKTQKLIWQNSLWGKFLTEKNPLSVIRKNSKVPSKDQREVCFTVNKVLLECLTGDSSSPLPNFAKIGKMFYLTQLSEFFMCF